MFLKLNFNTNYAVISYYIIFIIIIKKQTFTGLSYSFEMSKVHHYNDNVVKVNSIAAYLLASLYSPKIPYILPVTL